MESTLSIQRVPLDSLTLDPANARQHGPENLDAIVASPDLDDTSARALRNVLSRMDDPEALESFRKRTDDTITGFQAASDEDYDPVRKVMQEAEGF